MSAAFFEHFGSLRLKNHLREKISEEKIEKLTLAEIIIFLFGLVLITQPCYTKMIRVKEKRNELAHKPFAEADPKEAKRLIQDAIDCLKELGVNSS